MTSSNREKGLEQSSSPLRQQRTSEGEFCSEFTHERAWNHAAAGVDVTGWRHEGIPGRRHVGDIVSVVRFVGQVERLEHERQVPVFTQVEVLADAHIHLEEVEATHGKPKEKPATTNR